MAGGEARDRLFNYDPVTVPASGSKVLDLRGFTGFVALLNGGTATYTKCTSNGVAVPGQSAISLSSGTKVETPWPFVLVEAAGADCMVSAV